jgi:hypothetical protein
LKEVRGSLQGIRLFEKSEIATFFLKKICLNEKERVILLPETSGLPRAWHDYCL